VDDFVILQRCGGTIYTRSNWRSSLYAFSLLNMSVHDTASFQVLLRNALGVMIDFWTSIVASNVPYFA
jgi:hypothetical protein